MKKLRFALQCLASLMLAAIMPSCSSDPNPVGYLNVTGEKTTIELNFSVADTRADESTISTVSVYVFNSDNVLEELTEENDATSVKLDVTPGQKTIYAISTKKIIAATKGMTLDSFEGLTFASSETDLKNENGEFVMVGKQVVKVTKQLSQAGSTSESANKFQMELTRLLAKVSVKYDSSKIGSNLGSLGFTQSILGFNFKVVQIAKNMGLLSNSILKDFTKISSTGGTYDGYDNTSDSYKKVVTTTSKSPNLFYLSENIVDEPVSGNTTFVALKVSLMPKQFYIYHNNSIQNSNETLNEGEPFYAVGIKYPEYGYVDYAVSDTGTILCFKNNEEQDGRGAAGYATALNEGKTTATLLSDINIAPKQTTPKNVLGSRSEEKKFDVFQFTNGEIYYRLNIRDSEAKKYQVTRNTFYDITISSISKMGLPSEDLLFPTNPASDLELDLSSSSGIDASFEATPWNNIIYSEDL